MTADEDDHLIEISDAAQRFLPPLLAPRRWLPLCQLRQWWVRNLHSREDTRRPDPISPGTTFTVPFDDLRV